MSLYGDAIAAITSIVLIDERVQSLTGKVDRLADEVRRMADRLTRLETIVETARPDGAVLHIAPNPPLRPGDPDAGGGVAPIRCSAPAWGARAATVWRSPCGPPRAAASRASR